MSKEFLVAPPYVHSHLLAPASLLQLKVQLLQQGQGETCERCRTPSETGCLPRSAKLEPRVIAMLGYVSHLLIGKLCSEPAATAERGQ
jgi:hypothetical protein